MVSSGGNVGGYIGCSNFKLDGQIMISQLQCGACTADPPVKGVGMDQVLTKHPVQPRLTLA